MELGPAQPHIHSHTSPSLLQGTVTAKYCVGLVELGGTQGEMTKSEEAQRNEPGKDNEGQDAGLEHLTQLFSSLRNSLWKLQRDKVSRRHAGVVRTRIS